MIHPRSLNTVVVCKQINFLALYYITSKLVTLYKIIDAPIQIYDILLSYRYFQVR
jgi:hypothetical protein